MTVPLASTLDAYGSSGPSPTHLLGVGAVGRAWLHEFAHRYSVVGATDRTGSILAPRGLPPQALAGHKEGGRALVDWLDHAVVSGHCEPSPRAAIVLDATPTEPARGAADAVRIRGWLARGQRVALASKHALVADPSLLDDPRIGANAVLGGTGAQLAAALPELRASGASVAMAGSATSTVILEALEAGGTLADGLATARARGVLEPDPELDLAGTDAVLKLALVAGALRGHPVDPATLQVEDLRTVDPALVRARAARGTTTRLVGRAGPSGPLTLRYEELARSSPLAIPPTHLAYVYSLPSQRSVVHEGTGLGARGTAAALDLDAARLAARSRSPEWSR